MQNKEIIETTLSNIRKDLQKNKKYINDVAKIKFINEMINKYKNFENKYYLMEIADIIIKNKHIQQHIEEQYIKDLFNYLNIPEMKLEKKELENKKEFLKKVFGSNYSSEMLDFIKTWYEEWAEELEEEQNEEIEEAWEEPVNTQNKPSSFAIYNLAQYVENLSFGQKVYELNKMKNIIEAVDIDNMAKYLEDLSILKDPLAKKIKEELEKIYFGKIKSDKNLYLEKIKNIFRNKIEIEQEKENQKEEIKPDKNVEDFVNKDFKIENYVYPSNKEKNEYYINKGQIITDLIQYLEIYNQTINEFVNGLREDIPDMEWYYQENKEQNIKQNYII